MKIVSMIDTRWLPDSWSWKKKKSYCDQWMASEIYKLNAKAWWEEQLEKHRPELKLLPPIQ